MELLPQNLLLIVVGAHPRAEAHDRAVAYRLREDVVARLGHDESGAWGASGGGMGAGGVGGGGGRTPLVCTDVWYLNDDSLRGCPAVSIGSPEVNALSAYLADKLPSALVIDDRLMVQLDVEFADSLVCCWGVTHEQTAQAVELFTRKYLGRFLEAVAMRAS